MSATKSHPSEGGRADRKAVEKWIVGWLAQEVGVDASKVDGADSFHQLGVQSVQATRLAAELAETFGCSSEATLLWAYPTVGQLAGYVAGEEQALQATPKRRFGIAGLGGAREPLAVVGLAVRAPGAENKEALWRLLAGKVDPIIEHPRNRWEVDRFCDLDPAAPGKTVSRYGGFLEGVDLFDAPFFKVSPREAVQMDPQQRLLLELAWEALEDCGVPPTELQDQRVGVYVGAMFDDYSMLGLRNIDRIVQHSATGQNNSVLAGRISYLLGLQGPSMVVNTACSSSLVSVHLACSAIWNGEAEAALAGGINLILAPHSCVAMSKFGGLSKDGRCRSFDADASGYVRSEGGGMVLLKPLSRALVDGDPIYCTILASAVNNDGASNGLTAPSTQAQELLLRDAYARAGIDPAEVDYVEAHGTGTKLGDPIEARAVSSVLSAGRQPGEPLILGSVKSNLGHAESAAGILALAKTVLALKKGGIPPNLHFDNPNPHIPFEDWRLRVPVDLEPWPATPHPPTAGVSSFGFSGTNCHVVLRGLERERWNLLLLAADSADELKARAEEALGRLPEPPVEEALADFAYAVSVAYRDGAERIAVPFARAGRLRDELGAFLAGEEVKAVRASRSMPESDGRVAMVFSGQGSYWRTAGRDLFAAESAYREAFRECDRLIRDAGGASPLEHLLAETAESWEQQIDALWPYLFSHQIALASLWRSWGIEPSVVIGHSIGEVAAAHIAGALSLRDAVAVICAQGRFAQVASGDGTMLAVGLSWEDVQRRLEQDDEATEIHAAIDLSPTSSVVAGKRFQLERFAQKLDQESVFCRRVQASVASHTPQLEVHSEALEAALEGIRPRAARIPMISTVTAAPIDGTELGPRYWVRNFCEPVLFRSGLEQIVELGARVLLELNTHPILSYPMRDVLAGREIEGAVLASLRSGEPGPRTMREAYADLFALGVADGRPEVHTVYAGRLADGAGEQAVEHPDEPGRSTLLPLSARSAEALRARVEQTVAALDGGGNFSLEDLGYSAATKRAHMSHRLACTATTKAELRSALAGYLAGRVSGSLAVSNKGVTKAPPLAFVFSGQGTQWLGMARDLRRGEPVFADALARLDDLLSEVSGGDFALLDELDKEEGSSRIDDTRVAQPALYAIQLALAELWSSWGLRPQAVVGHSLGELAAFQFAGILSPRNGAELVLRRAELMQQATGHGRMAVVRLGAEEIGEFLDGVDGVSLAAVNAEDAIGISGDVEAMETVTARLEEREIKVHRLKVSYAFHSHQMEELSRRLEEQISHIGMTEPHLRVFSTVTGRELTAEDLGTAYWRRNMRQAVLFHPAVREMAGEGFTTFLEISPHPALAVNVDQTAREVDAAAIALPSLRRDRDSFQILNGSLAQLYVRGFDPEWGRLYPPGARALPLAKYPFQRSSYWIGPTRWEAEDFATPPEPAFSAPSEVPGDGEASGNGHGVPAEALPAKPPSLPEGAATTSETLRLDEEFIRIAAEIGQFPVDALEDHLSLQGDLGFDSLMLIQVRDRVAAELGGLELPQRLLYTDKPLAEIKEYVAAQGSGQRVGMGSAGSSASSGDAAWNLEPVLTRAKDLARGYREGGFVGLDKRFVHKHEAGNALLGEVEPVADNEYLCEMRRDDQHHFFYEHPQDHVPGLYLIEAARQLAMAVMHLHYGVPLGEQFVWDEFTVEFRKMVEHDAPVFLALRIEEFEKGTIFQRYHVIQDGQVAMSGTTLMRVFSKSYYNTVRGQEERVAVA